MYQKGFLTDINTEKGMFPNEKIVKTKTYEGEKISGFFDKDCIKKQGLEIWILAQKEDKVMIIPIGGKFLNEGQDKIVIVNKDALTYLR